MISVMYSPPVKRPVNGFNDPQRTERRNLTHMPHLHLALGKVFIRYILEQATDGMVEREAARGERLVVDVAECILERVLSAVEYLSQLFDRLLRITKQRTARVRELRHGGVGPTAASEEQQ
jgi:hypothetical protein